jgi:hypothetical protein
MGLSGKRNSNVTFFTGHFQWFSIIVSLLKAILTNHNALLSFLVIVNNRNKFVCFCEYILV